MIRLGCCVCHALTNSIQQINKTTKKKLRHYTGQNDKMTKAIDYMYLYIVVQRFNRNSNKKVK